MKMNFIPDSDRQDFSQAVTEYQEVWMQYQDRIISVWEEVTGLKFKESEINAIVYEGRSQSHPFLLRSNLDIERKATVLVHELGHRIIYKRQTISEINSLENHKTLFLVLYEVFEKTFGTAVADRAVEWDCVTLSPDVYKAAWDWALEFSKETRSEKFKERVMIQS